MGHVSALEKENPGALAGATGMGKESSLRLCHDTNQIAGKATVNAAHEAGCAVSR